VKLCNNPKVGLEVAIGQDANRWEDSVNR